MKKIALCIPSLSIGGAEKFTVDLAIEFSKEKDYEVIVVITRLNTESFLKKRLEDSKVRIVDLSGKSYIEMLKKQLKFLNKERPDIVHTNTGSILHMMLACLIFKIPRRIYTVHNEAKLLYGENKLKKMIYKKAFSLFGFVPVAICSTVKETLISDMKIKSNDIEIVNNGIDIKRFQVNFLKKSDNQIKIISVGRVCQIKNQKMMIESIYNIQNKGKKISLTLLGDGEDYSTLKKLISELKAEEYIFMLGRKKNVEDYLREADIYISASRTEGLPLSILEAMACGLPVVATAAGGSRDIVHNEVNGFLVSVDDQNKFEKSILELIENKEKRINFGKESRKISEQWSLQNCVEGYKKLYYFY